MLRIEIKRLAKEWRDDFISIRRHLHAHPELSYQEYETSRFVQDQLRALEIPFTVIANTGVVGVIEGVDPQSRVIALRADMDALPILEENDVPYKSQNPGVMHACGHDVHTTCLLGVARILKKLQAQWSGTVKLIFQPGEEKNPGGASLMIREGVLENPAPAAILGLHVHPDLPVGQFSFREGMAMASADEIYITVTGQGGHAAAPHKSADTILAASQLVVNLQQIISRRNDPLNPGVLSITSFNGGNTTNVLPGKVELMGTFRAMNETWRFEAHQLIKTICAHTAHITNTTIDLNLDIGYPYLYNNPGLTAAARELAEEFAGREHIGETELRMGAEDFAFYSHHIPACFYRLGVAPKDGSRIPGVHTPRFQIDESAIEEGVGMMAWLATQIEVGTIHDYQK